MCNASMKVFLNRLLSIKLLLPYILFVSLAGERGDDFADISAITIRNVVKGILWVAIIQGLLAGAGFMVAGVQGIAVRLRKFVTVYGVMKTWTLIAWKFQKANSKSQINSNESNSKNQTLIDP